jgi:hypothetical protein
LGITQRHNIKESRGYKKMRSFSYVMNREVWDVMRKSLLDYLRVYPNSFKFEPSGCYDRMNIEFYDVVDDRTESNIDGFYNEAVEVVDTISDFLEF